MIYWATSPPPSGVLGVAILFLQLFAWLPAYRVLMVWVYDRTQSLLIAMLMHGSLTAGMLILQPQEPLAMVGPNLLTWLLAFSAVWWIIVAAVGVATHGYAPPQDPLEVCSRVTTMLRSRVSDFDGDPATYATKYGGTRGIAERIAAALNSSPWRPSSGPQPAQATCAGTTLSSLAVPCTWAPG